MDKRNGPLTKYIPPIVQDVAIAAGWILSLFVAVSYLLDLFD
jgi:hypothetical protein